MVVALTSASPSALSELQVRLGYAFRQTGLLQQAVTHRSFSADHNERLEFLGDSVLNLSVAHLLYAQLASLPEGDLSRVRANLVKQDTLHQLAKSLNLSAVMRLGEGEMRSPAALAVRTKQKDWQRTRPHPFQSKAPMRLRLPKFIQTKKALPTMLASGTKPKKRESSELSRLSPIMK